MSRAIRLYADEHIATAVVRGLRQRGVDVITVVDAQARGATDENLLRDAREQGRVMLTQDDDFLRLHAAGRDHAGIVHVNPKARVGEIVRGVLLIHQLLDAVDMRRHVEFL